MALHEVIPLPYFNFNGSYMYYFILRGGEGILKVERLAQDENTILLLRYISDGDVRSPFLGLNIAI